MKSDHYITDIEIRHDKKEEVQRFRKLLSDWVNGDTEEGDDEIRWLANLAVNSGIGKVDSWGEIIVRNMVCGEIGDFVDLRYYGDHTLHIKMVQDIEPAIWLWRLILAQHMPDGKLSFTSFNRYLDDYITNMPETAGRYCVWDKESGKEYKNNLSKTELEKELKAFLKSKGENIGAVPLEELIERTEGRYSLDMHIWKYVAL